MFYLFFIPLLFITIGAFFFPLLWNASLLCIIILAFAIFERKSWIILIKNLVSMVLFVIPIIIMKAFTAGEGKVLHWFGIVFYEKSLLDTIETITKMILIGALSTVFFLKVFPIREFKKSRVNADWLNIVFLSMEIYQNALTGILSWVKTKRKTNLLTLLDTLYSQGKSTKKDENNSINQ